MSGLWHLGHQGRLALAGIVFAVCWWAFQVVPSAYCSMLLILYFILTGVGTPEHVLGFWTTPVAWLVIGAFLLAEAVSKSGLAERLSRVLLVPFSTDWPRLIIGIYLLNGILALVIPLPFPRAFILMTLVKTIISSDQISAEAESSLGFAVFASCIPSSMMFLTGEAVLNPVASSFAGDLTWMQWLKMMFIPATVSAVLMIAAHLKCFGSIMTEQPDDLFAEKKRSSGITMSIEPLDAAELRTIFWVAAAILFWVFDSYHPFHPGWVAAGAAVGLSLPVVGDVLGADDLTYGVEWSTLIFATGALAIGTVGTETGLADWIVSMIMPTGSVSQLGLLVGIAVAAFLFHLLIGSVLATLSMLSAPVVMLAAAVNLPTAPAMLLTYTAAVMGFALPFHNLMLLVGSGDEGYFTEKETLRFFPYQTLIAALVMAFQMWWWNAWGYW